MAGLVLVDGDPTNDVRDTRNLSAVRKRGIGLERAEPPG